MALIRNRSLRQISKWLIPSFFVVMTLFILILNDVLGDSDSFIVFSLFFFLLMSIFFVRWLIIQIKTIINLKTEKKRAELLHLKSQVNPHFFFNTLNNLYGLVDEDPAKAQHLILKLSDMMRYSIYEGQHDWVTLDQEIIYLENYISLHKMRYHKTIDVHMTIDVLDRNIKIMPLLFIILLENAFKHGVENLRKDAYININLSARKNRINFDIENNFDPEEINENIGIGLKNLNKRLDLVYPNQHQLKINTKDNFYRAQLSLEI